MALNPLQIERVRDIIGFTSYDATAALLAKLNAVQESETGADADRWASLMGKQTRIRGDGIETDKDRNRLEIVNRVRPRLGLPKISLAEWESSGGCDSYAVYTPPRDDKGYCG